MKTLGIAALVIIILAGGYYFFMGEKTETQEEMMPGGETVQDENMMGNEAMKDGDAMMEETGSMKEFTVSGNNFSFAPNTLSVKKGDTVRITFKNSGGFHDFVIDEFNAATKQIQGGAEETIEFVADRAGTFEYYCSVGTHRMMGMKGTLTVTE